VCRDRPPQAAEPRIGPKPAPTKPKLGELARTLPEPARAPILLAAVHDTRGIASRDSTCGESYMSTRAALITVAVDGPSSAGPRSPAASLVLYA
jgi:hypothetical protein